MASVDTELALVALAAMLSPTTLSFSVLALVLGERPLRTGVWFYLGALGVTLLIGVLAAFVLGDVAAPPAGSSTPNTWVCIVDILAGTVLLIVVVRFLRRPPDSARMDRMIAQMESLASSPAIAIAAAGATLANPGGFIPLALKDISQTGPTAAVYVVEWVGFALVSLLPLLLALLMLALAPDWTKRVLTRVRGWLERRAMTLAAGIVALLALALLRNGIAGLTG
jgi:Sap, sulfolipid-1-addressing protein